MEVLRRRFRHGDPALPLRHSARAALRGPEGDQRDEEWIGDVLVVISELVQNVNQHTCGAGELVVAVTPGSVRVEVGDTSTTVPRAGSPDARLAGGRGLLLIEAVSREWGVRTCVDGKTVWVELVSVAAPATPSG